MTAIDPALPGPKFYVITDEARKVDGENLVKDFGRMRVTMQELGNNIKMVTETNRLDRIPPLEGVVKEFLACAKGLSYTYQADGAASGAARKRVALPEKAYRVTYGETKLMLKVITIFLSTKKSSSQAQTSLQMLFRILFMNVKMVLVLILNLNCRRHFGYCEYRQ